MAGVTQLAAAPLHPYVAVAFFEKAHSAGTFRQVFNQASLLSLSTGQIHSLAETRARDDGRLHLDRAPSGLAVTCCFGDHTILKICHAPSASAVNPESMPDTKHTWSPKGDACVLTRGAAIVRILHITEAGITVCAAPPGVLIPPPRIPERTLFRTSAPNSSVAISPCSRAVIAYGEGCTGPLFIKQWQLNLPQGTSKLISLACEPVEKPVFEKPLIRWYPGAQLACTFAMLTGPSAVQIRSGTTRDTVAVASMPTLPTYTGGLCDLHWSDDGMQLACGIMHRNMLERLLILRFYSCQAVSCNRASWVQVIALYIFMAWHRLLAQLG